MGDLGTIGGAAKGIGEGIECAANGVDKLLARIQDMASGPLATRRAKKLADAANEAARGAVAVAEAVGVELSDREKRAIAFDAMHSIQGFANIEATISMACLPDDADFGAIDDEWMSAFVNGAKEAFSDWKREVFAHAVESKAADPSTMSIRALHAISKMEREDIRCFEIVCGLMPESDGAPLNPMIVTLDPSALQIVGLSPDSVMALCDIGILRQHVARIRKIAADESTCSPNLDTSVYQMCHRIDGRVGLYTVLRFSGSDIEVPVMSVHVRTSIKKEMLHYVDYGSFQLTDAGRSLAEIVRPKTELRIADYIELGYKIEGKRESESLSDGVFCEREFDRAVSKSLNRILR